MGDKYQNISNKKEKILINEFLLINWVRKGEYCDYRN